MLHLILANKWFSNKEYFTSHQMTLQIVKKLPRGVDLLKCLWYNHEKSTN